jgi:hypothetical protein
MAELSRRRTHRLALAAALAASLLVLVACVSPERALEERTYAPAGADEVARDAVDLIGTWHVLIHYTDDHSHAPDQMRWSDKVWAFERSGSQLRWTEYPNVVFEDQTGRFENFGDPHASRVLGGWEPNEAQSAQIRTGLEVNDRGSKSKTLRKHGDDGWRSATRPTAAAASIVTYVENWSIEDAAGMPVFRREDVLGSGIAENLEGVTEYATTKVASGGDVLRGTFERDGTRHGTFRLLRAEVPDEMREQLRAEIRAAAEKNIRESGRDPDNFESEIDSLARQIERRMLDEGRSLQEVEQMLEDGRIKP